MELRSGFPGHCQHLQIITRSKKINRRHRLHPQSPAGPGPLPGHGASAWTRRWPGQDIRFPSKPLKTFMTRARCPLHGRQSPGSHCDSLICSRKQGKKSMDAPKKNRRICVGGKRPSGLRLVSAPGMREHRLGTGRFQRREEPRPALRNVAQTTAPRTRPSRVS